ncbi:hypothetical protein LPJ61_002990 [Coemansia biformis]|uniref:VanZ-like domain-containing protein n=1 Tax=Coemansia biformis TaxID=1286918 RepID=A0A9W7YDQ7_9FUNG|nr:hypothetical protein LPJ61_002990 [Coemansia biformis]
MWRTPMATRLRLPVVAVLAAWMALLAVLGFTRLLAVPVPDKAQHFVAFGVLCVLVFFSFRPDIPRRKAWTVTGVLGASACFFSEVLQRVLTTRPFEWSDVAANFLGAGTFLFAAWMADRWIIQPRSGAEAVGGGGGRYWALDADAQASVDLEAAGELGLELDDILADSPTTTEAASSRRSSGLGH